MYWALADLKISRAQVYALWKVDLWGFYRSRLYIWNKKTMYFLQLKFDYLWKIRRQLQRIVYTWRPAQNYKRFKKLKNFFLTKKLNSFFNLTLSDNFVKKIYIKTFSQKGSALLKFYMRLELRLWSILYRLNICSNIFMLRQVGETSPIVVNGEYLSHINSYIKIGDFISISSSFLKLVFSLDLLLRFFYGVIFLNVPRYFYADHKFFFFVLFKWPSLKDIAYPHKLIEFYRISESLKF